MKKQIAFFIIAMLAFSLAHAQQQASPPAGANPLPAPHQPNSAGQFSEESTYINSSLTYHIIDAPHNTFGYDVLVNGRLMIHQTNIPGMSGNDGFKTKEDASKVAEMVMRKISKGEMPPTVNEDEMKNLGVSK